MIEVKEVKKIPEGMTEYNLGLYVPMECTAKMYVPKGLSHDEAVSYIMARLTQLKLEDMVPVEISNPKMMDLIGFQEEDE